MQLTWLPSELLVTILTDLDFRTLLLCREVCTSFKTLIDKDVRAQYKIELAVAGMQDGATKSFTTAERLNILRNRQTAWSKFSWTAKETVPMLTGDVWELYGNVLAQSEGRRTLHFKQIPSAIRGIAGNEWTISDVGCNITEIGIDPTQDLLLVIEHFEDETQLTCRIHVHWRSLSTGAPHPAGPPTAMLTHEPEPGVYSYEIQTSEGYLGVLISSQELGDPSELVVWDWKTGRLHLHLADLELYSYAFLTSRFLLISHGGTAFDVPRLIVIDLESPQPSSPVAVLDAHYVCSFHYPQLEDNISVLSMPIRSDPGANWHPNPTLGVPFSVSCKDFLFAITLWGTSHDDEFTLLSLVPASTFLGALATLTPGETGRDFAWDEWGPWGSRLMEAPSTYSVTDMHYVYGMAFAVAERHFHFEAGTAEEMEIRKFVVVRDFNQLALRRWVAGHSGEHKDDSGEQVVAYETTLELGGVFKEEVTTALPYVERLFEPFESSRSMENPAVSVPMLTEDAVVLVGELRELQSQYCIFSI